MAARVDSGVVGRKAVKGMARFETASHRGIYWAIALSIAAVFALDLQTRIGVVTWLLYLIPLMLCFFVWRPGLPLAVAAVSSVLLVIDYLDRKSVV